MKMKNYYTSNQGKKGLLIMCNNACLWWFSRIFYFFDSLLLYSKHCSCSLCLYSNCYTTGHGNGLIYSHIKLFSCSLQLTPVEENYTHAVNITYFNFAKLISTQSPTKYVLTFTW